MNLSYFIAKRISFKRTGGFTGAIHRIAVASIAIGLAVMIVSFMILGGFQNVIANKVFTFTGHYQVNRFSLSNDFEETPVSTDSQFYSNSGELDFIKHVQGYATKAGLLKGEEEVEGVILKGIGPDFDSASFAANFQKGRFIQFSEEGASNEVILSSRIANRLMLDVGDKVVMYFVQDPPRFRNFDIVGIYETFLEDFDNRIILGDIQTIRNLNGWEKDQVGGFEVFIDDPAKIDFYEEALYQTVDYDLRMVKVTDKFIQIFDWLYLLNNNVYLFLALILFVAMFNMVSILFILIMERTQMIGVLKALGAKNSQVRQVFVWNGVRIIGKGLWVGNLIALGFGAFQYYTKTITLNPENYYMSYVPIHWDWLIILGMNVLILVVTTAILFVPAMVISNIKPIKAIRFD